MDRIAVLIPCYNEALTIKKVIEDFRASLPDAAIYVYDNNSTDGTDEIARVAGAVVRYERKPGKGNVIRSMFLDINAECYIITDGDDTYPAEDAPKLAEKVLEHGADMVIGDRLSSTYYAENKRLFHNFGNNLVRGLINTLFKSRVTDIMTGYRAFSYRFVKTFPVISKEFEIETEMTIYALDKNLNLDNVVIQYRDRPEGSESKLNTVSDGIKVLKTIAQLVKNYKPMLFFGMLSAVLFILSTLILLPVLREYIMTGMVPRFPTLICCSFAYLAAMLMLASGLVLDVIAHKNRQDFESRLHNIYGAGLTQHGQSER